MALSFCLVITSRAQPVTNQFWQGRNIYQIITDRFFDGDPSNNNADGNYDPSGSRGTSVHGGDFKGIEQKLDYIKALGATAIWISPIVVNARGEFHGYAARDFYHIDPHWGTLADLQHMIQAAHARGMLVIDDIVVNHGGNLTQSTEPGFGKFKAPPDGYHLEFRDPANQFAPPFNVDGTNRTLAMLFHNNGHIQNFKDQQQVELGELSGLDDFRTESAYVRSNMAAIYQYWIAEAGFDGFRIDTVKHVEMGFWQEWCPAIHDFAAAHGKPDFFMFGEIYGHSESQCGSYTGTQGGGAFKLDSVLDYPLYYAINNVFAKPLGNTRQIEDHYKAMAANYDAAAQMRLVTFLDNHDQPRFLSPANASNNTARLEVALAFLYTSRGIPCLYYGTEQAFNGGNDPYDREDMFAGKFEQGPSLGDNFNMSHPLFQLVAKLNNFRRLYPALQTGSHINRWNDPNGPGLFAYERRLGTQEVFVVFNTASTSQTLTNRSTSYAAGTVLANLLDTNETFSVLSGSVTPLLTVPAMAAKIFIAQSQMLPLDPVVISNSPAHAATNVATSSPVVIQFSQPMDTNSVQTAFSVTPAVSGSFSWSPAHDTLTFTPGADGWAKESAVTIRLADSAKDAVAGKTFHAPYESRFSTIAAKP